MYVIDPRAKIKNGWFVRITPVNFSGNFAAQGAEVAIYDAATGKENLLGGSSKVDSNQALAPSIKAVTYALARGNKNMLDKFPGLPAIDSMVNAPDT